MPNAKNGFQILNLIILIAATQKTCIYIYFKSKSAHFFNPYLLDKFPLKIEDKNLKSPVLCLKIVITTDHTVYRQSDSIDFGM